MTAEKLDNAIEQATERFNNWVDVTGVFVRNTSYYFECLSCIEEAVHIGIMTALDIPIKFDNCDQLIKEEYNA